MKMPLKKLHEVLSKSNKINSLNCLFIYELSNSCFNKNFGRIFFLTCNDYNGKTSFAEVAYNPIIAPVKPPATSVDKISPETVPPTLVKSVPFTE